MSTVRDRLRATVPSGLALLGISGCVLCCALPLLLAAGVLTGSAAAFLTHWLPGTAAGLVALGAVAWWWTSRSPRCTTCGDDRHAGESTSTLQPGCSCGARA